MTVTQTWRVGPRNDKDGERRREIDSGRTLTLHRRRLTVTINARERRSPQQRQELALGVNSFSLTGNGKLQWDSGRKEGAAFEIEVNEAGAFYFGLRESVGAKLNGRVCGWARLRFGDAIEIGEWSVRVEDSDHEAERTVVLRGTDKKSAKRSVKRIVLALVFFALMATGVLGALFMIQGDAPGSSTALIEPVDRQNEEQSVESPAKEEVGTPAKVAVEDVEEIVAFGEQDFDMALRRFRNGEEKAACEMLRVASSAERKNIWTDKALLFIKRRCESL